jgi:hypothetical protein
VLVLDCLAGTLTDARLVAHLAPDEPHGIARLLAEMYIADPTRGRCASLNARALEQLEDPEGPTDAESIVADRRPLVDARACVYAIREVSGDAFGLELRWTRSATSEPDGAFETLTLRDVVGALEDYEPALPVTSQVLAVDRDGSGVSALRLRAELQRMVCSRIVLNRGLREAVQREMSTGLSMSEIAIRCGRVKRDAKGNESGETSWLARRLGVLPEGGQSAPTPWVHSDVLALIARCGLSIAPREVEL